MRHASFRISFKCCHRRPKIRIRYTSLGAGLGPLGTGFKCLALFPPPIRCCKDILRPPSQSRIAIEAQQRSAAAMYCTVPLYFFLMGRDDCPFLAAYSLQIPANLTFHLNKIFVMPRAVSTAAMTDKRISTQMSVAVRHSLFSGARRGDGPMVGREVGTFGRVLGGSGPLALEPCDRKAPSANC